MAEEANDSLVRKRRRGIYEDSDRTPKVARRVLPIKTHIEDDEGDYHHSCSSITSRMLPVLFVPIDAKLPPVKISIPLEEDMDYGVVIVKLAERFKLPKLHILLRQVEGDMFKQVSIDDKILSSSPSTAAARNTIIAYETPQLRARVKKIYKDLQGLPSSFIAHLENLKKSVYHWPFRMLRVIEKLYSVVGEDDGGGINDDTKHQLEEEEKEEEGKQTNDNDLNWAKMSIHIEEGQGDDVAAAAALCGTANGIVHEEEPMKSARILRRILRESSSMEQYVVLTIASRDETQKGSSRWNHLAVPQYVPYIPKETTFRQMRELIKKYTKRALFYASRQKLYSMLTSKKSPIKMVYTMDHSSRLKEFLISGAKLIDFPSSDVEDNCVIGKRITAIICDCS